jgi:hypothetical protein
MEPLSREERDAMKQNGRGVTDAEIDEYEQLLVQRHWNRNDVESEFQHGGNRADERIEELYEKLYNKRPSSSSRVESED